MKFTDDLERRMADYYQSEAPARAPDWLLARALDVIDTTRQRRTVFGQPWGIAPMPFLGKLAAGAVAIAIVGAVGVTILRLPSVGPAAPATPEPSSSPSALPPPLTGRFESTLNGISMNYPAGWQTRPATELWTSRALTFREPGVDIIFDPALGEDLYLGVASEPLDGRSERDWVGSVNQPCNTQEGWAGYTVTLDPWRPHSTWSCARKVFVTTDTHAYAIVLHLGDEALADTYSDAWFQSVLDTVDLLADEAPSSSPSALPPPLTERFDSTLHGISMDYPAGWQTRPASEPWTDGVISFDAPGFDIIFDPARGEDLYFALASEPSGGRPDHEWQGDVTLPNCGGGHGGGVLTFDGAKGWVVTCYGSPANHSALLVTDTQGYAIVLYLADGRLVDTYSGAWFVSVLETLDLHAQGAPDDSNPSESP